MDREPMLEQLIRKYYPPVYYYCLGKLNSDPQGAADCTQEVFLLLCQKYQTLDLTGNIRLWLYKTADNMMNNYLRREARHKHESLDEIEIEDDGGLACLLNDPLADWLMERLTEKDVALLTAYYSAERGHREEVAKQFGMTLARLYDEIERIKRLLSG